MAIDWEELCLALLAVVLLVGLSVCALLVPELPAASALLGRLAVGVVLARVEAAEEWGAAGVALGTVAA